MCITRSSIAHVGWASMSVGGALPGGAWSMHRYKSSVGVPGGVEEVVGEQGYGGDITLCTGAGIACGEDKGDTPCMPA